MSMMAETVKLSKYQEDFLSFVKSGTGDVVVNAVAGSGKSFTLVEAAKLVGERQSAIFFAFNKHIAEHLGSKLPQGFKASTIHSFGYQTIKNNLAGYGKLNIDDNKYNKLSREYIEYRLTPQESYQLARNDEKVTTSVVNRASALNKLVNFARLTLVDVRQEEALSQLIERYDVTIDSPESETIIREGVLAVIRRGIEVVRKARVVDFTDMVFIPYALGMMPFKFDVIMVDEAQDLNAAQRNLVLSARAKGGRIFFVGDKCQPAGTKILTCRRTTGGKNKRLYEAVNIENLVVGDKVVGYCTTDSAFYNNSVVTGITERPYKGTMITVQTSEGQKSKYTAGHHVVTSFAPFRDKYCVYVMQKGRQFRVGMSKCAVAGGSGSGPVARLLHEGADKSWILSFHETRSEAFIYEQAIAGKFGLPQLVWNTHPIKTVGLVEQAWDYIGDNYERGVACLESFNRFVDYPLFTAGNLFRQSLKRPIRTFAANLMDGCLVLVHRGVSHAKGTDWLPISVSSEEVEEVVYSLTVEKHHTYVADGIMTHNCQAIMGFSGADTQSFEEILTATKATLLPLSICYRCPTRHLDLARILVPQIEARENAPAGEVRGIHTSEAVDAIQPGALVISRKTAPLVRLCIKLIRGRKAARVRGRDIAKGLTDLAFKVGRLGGDFILALSIYKNAEVKKLSQKEGNQNRIDLLNDKCEALEVCYTDFNCQNVQELCRNIDSIFSGDDDKVDIMLSTIHRAKGLEADTVFLLEPKMLPFVHPRQRPEDVVQELNVTYVALTRAKETLVFVHEDDEALPKVTDIEHLDIEALV